MHQRSEGGSGESATAPARGSLTGLKWSLPHRAADQLAREEQHYRARILRNPQDDEALHRLGLIAYEAREFAAAERLVRCAIANSPLNGDYWRNLGATLHAQGQHQGAVAAYRNSLAIKPQSAGTLKNLANALFAESHFDQAAAAYRQALLIEPKDLGTLCNLAAVLKELAHYEEAIRILYRALAIDPGHSEALTRLNSIRVASRWQRTSQTWHGRRRSQHPGSFGERLLIGRACEVPGVISRAQCNALISYASKLPTAGGRIGAGRGRDGEDIRRSAIRWVELNSETVDIYDLLMSFVLEINHAYYGLRLDGLEVLQFAEYDASAGSFYDWHTDHLAGSNGPAKTGRRLSVSVQLSDPDTYRGGSLEFRAGELVAPAITAQGSIIVFPSSTLHRVGKVTHGRRHSLVCWFTGKEN